MNPIARLLDSLSAAAFKTDGKGRTLYFPNGVMGRGYVVPDEATLGSIKSKLRWFYGAMLLSIGAGIPILNNVASGLALWPALVAYAGAMAVLMAGAFLVTSLASSGLERSEERLRFAEAVSMQAKTLPRWATLAMMGFWSLCLISGLAMLAGSGEPKTTLVALATLVSSIVLLAMTIVIHRARA